MLAPGYNHFNALPLVKWFIQQCFDQHVTVICHFYDILHL